METNEKFTNSPIHDKGEIIKMMDKLEPKEMVTVVAFIMEQLEKSSNDGLNESSLVDNDPMICLKAYSGGVNSSFYSLIDRLQKHSEWKYERKWGNNFYYSIAFRWIGREKELEERVLKLENDMRLAGVL